MNFPSRGLAYYFTGRDQYATHAATLLRVWFLDAASGMTRICASARVSPGIADGRGIGIIETVDCQTSSMEPSC